MRVKSCNNLSIRISVKKVVLNRQPSFAINYKNLVLACQHPWVYDSEFLLGVHSISIPVLYVNKLHLCYVSLHRSDLTLNTFGLLSL